MTSLDRAICIAAAHPKIGVLMLDGFAGRVETKVEIVGETPKRFRIRAIERTRLAGLYRWLQAGDEALVPKDAVRLEP